MYLRKAHSQDDFSAISCIYAQSWKAAYQGKISQEYLDTLDEERWTPYLLLDQHHLLVAVEEENIGSSPSYVGACSYNFAREPSMTGWGEIVSLYLLPSHFHKGIGHLLLERALQELSVLGFTKAYLWVLSTNTAARLFYEKNDLQWNGDLRCDRIGNQWVEELRFCKRLK